MTKLYIFDLDGTIADLIHRLHYIRCPRKERNWKKFHTGCVDDTPIHWTIDLMDLVHERGDILILSGRSQEHEVKGITEDWLGLNNIGYDHLRMRPAGDYRDDAVLKKEMLSNFLAEYPEYEVQFIVDDRQRVVDMWRENGYKVLQCNAWEEQVDWDKWAKKAGLALVNEGLDVVGENATENWMRIMSQFLKENFKER